MENQLIINGKRTDGREPTELRPLKIEVGIIKNAAGSSYIEHGKNKIIVAIYGPKDSHRYGMNLEKATLRCRYHMSPFSTEERKNPQPSRREIELSKVIRDALEPSLILENFPKTMIDIFIEVLQSDGGSRSAGITAASVALADAGIPMKDLVEAVAVGKVNGTLVVDLNDIEDKEGEADMPVAFMLNENKITLLQMDGKMTVEEFKAGLMMAMEAAKKIKEIQKEALLKKYSHEENKK
ncbi:MAG: exosome complex exonuclease Rrp41 [Nitrososphaeria archaeon]|jgi:exosome complex component RRP41